MFDRIYVCHTFYHVYVACLKEFYIADGGKASLVLSKMSNKFGGMIERAKKSDIFEEVFEYDTYEDFPGSGQENCLYLDKSTQILYTWDEEDDLSKFPRQELNIRSASGKQKYITLEAKEYW